jgi:cell division protein ZapA (FtsZ GTPase activity inhibitor)
LEHTVTLQIFGRKFTFQTESGMPDAKKVAARFEDAVQKVQSQFDGKRVNVDRETILVLTGLNIASEHFNCEERYHQFFDRMTKKSAVVLNELDKAIL